MYNQIIIIGVLISLIYSEFINLNAGIIIPGYFALSLSSPDKIFWTLVVSIISYIICKIISMFTILYGKRKFAIFIIVSFFISFFILKDYNVIGILIPGIIAREIDRQGIIYTILSILITTSIVVLIMFLMGYPVFR